MASVLCAPLIGCQSDLWAERRAWGNTSSLRGGHPQASPAATLPQTEEEKGPQGRTTSGRSLLSLGLHCLFEWV